MRSAAVVALGLALAAPSAAAPSVAPATTDLDARVDVVARTRALLAERRAEQVSLTARRLRALYKLGRAARTALWFDPAARAARVRQRAAAARILGRDLAELAILDREARAAAAAALAAATARAIPPAPAPPPGSLARPVSGAAIVARAGAYRENGVALTRRGLELAVRPDAEVVAPAAGRVRYAGPLRGLGGVVVIDHGDYRSVLSGLADLRVAADRAVARGETVGVAADTRIGVEIRLRTGDPAGAPIDPSSLFGR